MASTSAAEPSSAMEESPNWLEMPQELMAMILHRLGAVEILNSVQKVCTTWRRISRDPAMWKIINVAGSIEPVVSWNMDDDLVNLTKQAIHLSCGDLVDISIDGFCTDHLLDHISRRSSKLNSLCLMNCHRITSAGLTHAVKLLPNLEKLHLYYTSIFSLNIEEIARNCPHLKSFKMVKDSRRSRFENDDEALSIANNMPELRHLQLFGNKMSNDGLEAILNGCPHLESLDVRRCFNLNLRGNLGKLCRERIKDFKHPHDSTENCGFDPRMNSHDDDDLDDMYSSGFSDLDQHDFYDFFDEEYEDYDVGLVSEDLDFDYIFDD